MKDIIFDIKSHPLWEDFEKDLLEHRPPIPLYSPEEDNSKRWEYESARRDGFDILLSLLKIEV